jgi:2-polyprenyl-6-methoxyphenol hydroxylase-like FAD-dependent oxidoreductase
MREAAPVARAGGPRLPRGKRISIIGAGPVGLTLARLLQMRDVDVVLFERDASELARSQGGLARSS